MRRMVIVILSVGHLVGAQPLVSQSVGDRVRVTTATGAVTGRVLAVTESSLDLSLGDGRSESFGRTAIIRLERSGLSRATRSLHGFLHGTGVFNSTWLFFVESDRRKLESEAEAVTILAVSAILGGGLGAAIGLLRGEAWEDITFGSTDVAASNGRQTLVGIRAGYGVSSHSAAVPADEFGIARMIAGVDVAVPLRSGIELRIGGAFAPKGYGDWETVETNYVQGSVLVRAGTPRDRGPSAGLLFGPWLAFGLSCSVFEWEARQELLGGKSYVKTQSRPCGEEFRKLDLGIAMGAAVEVPFRTSWIRRLDIDLVYSFGFGTHTTYNFFDFPPERWVFETGGRTRHLTIQTGFVIPVGN